MGALGAIIPSYSVCGQEWSPISGGITILTVPQKTVLNAKSLIPGFSEIIVSGKLHALFNVVMEEGRRILDDDNYDSVGQKQYVLNTTLGETKQALAIAVKRSMRCCSLPPEVRGGYDRKTGRHSLLVRCNHCGCSLYLEEQGERRYCPGSLNQSDRIYLGQEDTHNQRGGINHA